MHWFLHKSGMALYRKTMPMRLLCMTGIFIWNNDAPHRLFPLIFFGPIKNEGQWLEGNRRCTAPANRKIKRHSRFQVIRRSQLPYQPEAVAHAACCGGLRWLYRSGESAASEPVRHQLYDCKAARAAWFAAAENRRKKGAGDRGRENIAGPFQKPDPGSA